jgi:peptidyl-prolyl cis-trans isomerase NIMA-interacting 1
MSSSKKLPYFFNSETKQSSWDAPRELSEDEINQLPGAKEYLKPGKSSHEGQVRASHLLIKHSGSRRPASWKEVGTKIY